LPTAQLPLQGSGISFLTDSPKAVPSITPAKCPVEAAYGGPLNRLTASFPHHFADWVALINSSFSTFKKRDVIKSADIALPVFCRKADQRNEA